MPSAISRRITLLAAVCGTVAGTTLLAVPGASAASAATGHAVGHATASTCSRSYLPLPDPSCTPGTLNPDVTQSTIHSTICVSGWTATVRPPTSYTNPLKIQQIAEYGYSDTDKADYEEDHMVPLELGGSPRDPQNLWPEPHAATGGYSSYSKDTVENRLKTAVCNGTVTLSAARHAIMTNWTTALQSLGLG